MNHLIEQASLSAQIACDSAGTSDYHIGSPPDRRMTDAAGRRKIKLRGKARQFQPADFENFDLILAMDWENYRDIVALAPQGKYRERVHLLCDFATHHTEREVPDPYYGGQEGFERVIDLLLDACAGLLQFIIRSKLTVSEKQDR